MKKIIIYNINTSPGVRVIIDNLLQNLRSYGFSVEESNNCDEPDAIYIPYAIKASYDCLKKKRLVLVNLMVDYLSYGCKNRAISLLKNGYLFSKELWIECACFLLYRFKEKRVLKGFDSHMLVSYNDILRMKQLYENTKYYCVPNGCSIPSMLKDKTTSNSIRLGMLSMWTDGTLADVKWFIEGYLPKIKKIYPNLEVCIAGKCSNKHIEAYFRSADVKYYGWVDNLNDYFSNIDIYVATVPKGCGILNKVLDAFAHKTLCIGHNRSFSGFYGLQEGYIACTSVDDYINAIQLYISDKYKVEKYINNAFSYIKRNNDWEHNYKNFINELIEDKKELLNG